MIFSVESEGRREALGELLARIKVAPKRILRLDEAVDNGRYLMIGAAEHGFIDSKRNLALTKAICLGNAWRVAAVIRVAPSTRIH